MNNNKPCGCAIQMDQGFSVREPVHKYPRIIYCNLHKAAEEMANAIESVLNRKKEGLAINWKDLSEALKFARGE